MRVRRFLDPNISSCRWPSISFPVVTSFGDCSHAYRSDVHHRSVEAVTFIDQAEFRLLVLRATLLVTSYFLTITYDRAGFTYKTLTNHMYFPHRGAYAPYAPCMSTPLCFRVLQQSANLRKESKGTIIRPYTMYRTFLWVQSHYSVWIILKRWLIWSEIRHQSTDIPSVPTCLLFLLLPRPPLSSCSSILQ